MYLTMAHIEIIDEYSASIDLFEKNRSLLTAYLVEDKIAGTIATTKDRGIPIVTGKQIGRAHV